MVDVVFVDGLSKVFGSLRAVDSVSFTVGREFFSIMGPNGSGKTTLVSMISGVLRPSSGVVRIMGFDMWGSGGEMVKARSLIGYAPQKPPLRFDVSAYDNLVWHCLIRGLSLVEARSRSRELLELVGLGEHAGKSVWKLSGGMVRRLVIASALVGEPEVLVLDEPGSGLDPGALDSLWSVILKLSKGRTVLFTSHNPLEAERFSDRVTIMFKGRVAVTGRPLELIERYTPNPIVYVTLASESIVEVEGCSLLGRMGRIAAYEAVDQSLCVQNLLNLRGLVEKIEVRKPGLGEVFKKVTGAFMEVEGR